WYRSAPRSSLFPYTTLFRSVIDQRVGVDASGTIVAWDYEAWFASRGGRPGYDRPGNVITGVLAGFEPQPSRPAQAAEPTGAFNRSEEHTSELQSRSDLVCRL